MCMYYFTPVVPALGTGYIISCHSFTPFSWRRSCWGTWIRMPYDLCEERKSGLPLQTGRVTVEVVLVTGGGTRIGVLPESLVLPAIRQSADAAGIAGDPQWVVGSERGAITGASLPPIGSGVDYRVAALAGMVGVGEILDPADHRRIAQAITSGATRVVCTIDDGGLVSGSRRSRVGLPYIRCRGHLGGFFHRHSSLHHWRQSIWLEQHQRNYQGGRSGNHHGGGRPW